MKIVADENIPLLEAFFSDLSTSLFSKPGRELTAADVKDADILLVRSITKVNSDLLDGSTVKFVGTCTIGIDHLDTEYLQQQGIGYSNAPGCNAQAVVDYVLSALVTLGERWQQPWRQLSVGIVGAGNVGGRLYKTLSGLGVNVVVYDPNIAEFSSTTQSEQVWQQDVVTLHTPILKEGPYKTLHLVDAARLTSMKPRSALINSCRGPVVNNSDLLNHLNSHADFQAILDVYEDEPSPSDAIINACLLATPHIAGYSLDGKYRGTSMIYDALCDFLNKPKQLTLEQLASPAALQQVTVSSLAPEEFALKTCIRSAYDIRDDHFRMLSLLGLSGMNKAKAFDRLRKDYPIRRDQTQLTFLQQGLSSEATAKMSWVKALGLK
jgi:erythronate-4-phosphate dehydrogenase